MTAADLLLRPPPHAVRDHALPAGELADLLDFTLAHEMDFHTTRAGGQVDLDTRASRALPRPLFKSWKPRIRTWIEDLLPDILTEIGVAPFAISRLELQLAAHNDGDFYRTHLDTRIGGQDERGKRLVSMVYYFHREPKAFSGGDLRIYSLASRQTYVDIAPEQNRLVAFPSWVPHEVRDIACPSGAFADSRFTINCWAWGMAPATPHPPQS